MSTSSRFVIKIRTDSYVVRIYDVPGGGSTAESKVEKWQRGEKFLECLVDGEVMRFGKNLGPMAIVSFPA